VPASNAVFRLEGGNEDNDLWCERFVSEDGSVALLSTWDLSEEERAAIATGGTIELAVYGEGHPPVSLVVGASLESSARVNLSVDLPDEVVEAIARRAAELVLERQEAIAPPAPAWLRSSAVVVGGAGGRVSVLQGAADLRPAEGRPADAVQGGRAGVDRSERPRRARGRGQALVAGGAARNVA